MSNCPHTPDEIDQMLETAGVSSFDELFSDIEPGIRSKPLNLEDGKSEFEVLEYLKGLSEKNTLNCPSFIGGGFYDHYIPSVIDPLAGRAEFYTAYTPYQPECSQGTLQALYEYQTSICRLTGMYASNASLYDGGTALAEAAIIACRSTGRNKIIIDECVNPLYRDIISTYLSSLNCSIICLEHDNYNLNRAGLEKILDNETAAVILQNPNFFGSIDDYTDLTDVIHSKSALAILSVYPVSLGLLKTPSEMGIDIAAGEGQSLGNPLNFGGPYLGFIAVEKKYIRKLPGRIAGATIDKDGKKGYVLTLQAREQHIRREKATSNICTNQNLCALRALIYLVSLGKQGFKEVAELSYNKAYYAKKMFSDIKGISIRNTTPVFNEFTLGFDKNAETVYSKMLEKGILAGIPLGKFYSNMENDLLVCVTEKTKKEDIESYAALLQEIL
ncbi:aminomethyl-transferring glycine dehydrogenase subunit GcvPA [Elusimicrobiota bacterium]